MANNLTIKDGNAVSREIHTIEDSTSAHYNMSIPITVSGAPLFLDQPGNVSVTNSKFDVSVSPSQASIPVSIAGGSLSITDNAPVSVRGGLIGLNAGTNLIGRVSIAGISDVSVSPNGLNIPVSIAGINNIVPDNDAKGLSGFNGLITIPANYVFSKSGNNWDKMPGTSVGIFVQGNASAGATNLGRALIIGGTDGTNNRTLLTTTGGALVVHVSNTAPGTSMTQTVGAAVSTEGYPILGTDGTLARIIRTDTTGRIEANVSLGSSTAQIGRVSVFVDQVPFNVSINNTLPILVSINGQVSLAAGVDKRVIGAVSIADATLAAAQSGTWTVQPGNTANTTPWLVSVGGNVSITDNAPVSVRGGVLGAVSIGGGTAQIGRVSVFVDQVPFNVSVNNALPILTSVNGIVKAHVCNVMPDHGVTQSGTWTVQPGNTPNTAPWLISEVPTSTDGLTIGSAIVSAITSGSLLKAAAGKLYSISGFNNAATPLYLRMFNKATAPAAADTPVLRFVIPGNTAGAGFVYNIPPGATFATGIGWRISSGLIDTDATANTDNQGYVNFLYK